MNEREKAIAAILAMRELDCCATVEIRPDDFTGADAVRGFGDISTAYLRPLERDIQAYFDADPAGCRALIAEPMPQAEPMPMNEQQKARIERLAYLTELCLNVELSARRMGRRSAARGFRAEARAHSTEAFRIAQETAKS